MGIELDRAVGEHSGVFRGRFNLFQAAPNCGIVVKPEEVKLAPSSSPSRGSSSRRRSSVGSSAGSSISSRRSATAGEGGRRATMSLMQSAFKMGDWVRVQGFAGLGQIKWMGTLKSDARPVPRIGIELNQPIGLHSGTIEGQVLFTCAPKHGVVAHLSKVSPADASEVAVVDGRMMTHRQRSSSLGGAPVILAASDDPYNDPAALAASAASAFEGFGGFSEPAPLPPVPGLAGPVGFSGFDEPESLPLVPGPAGQQRSGSVAARGQTNSRDDIVAKLLAYYAKHAPGTKTAGDVKRVAERYILWRWPA